MINADKFWTINAKCCQKKLNAELFNGIIFLNGIKPVYWLLSLATTSFKRAL